MNHREDHRKEGQEQAPREGSLPENPARVRTEWTLRTFGILLLSVASASSHTHTHKNVSNLENFRHILFKISE